MSSGWKRIVTILLPIALLPLPLYIATQEAKCAYVILLMGIFWMTEVIPIPVTALLPVALYPLLGVISTKEASQMYMSEYAMMFLASIMGAVAFEHSNLHRRIALRTLLFVGTSPKRLTFGFLVATMVLSMWIFNTATAAMMIPIVDAIIKEMYASDQKSAEKDFTVNGNFQLLSVPPIIPESNHEKSPLDLKIFDYEEAEKKMKQARQDKKDFARLHKALLLSIPYGATCGGTGTLIGTSPNLIMKGILEELFPECKEVTFASWMMYGVPGMILCGIASWLCIIIVYLRNYKGDKTGQKSERARIVLEKKYMELGSISFHETAVLLLFVFMVLLWFFRDPQFLTGWAKLAPNVKITNATPALLVLLFMFIVPAHPRQFLRSEALLEWKPLQEKVPWGVIILFGGALAMGEGIKKSGLSVWLGNQLIGLKVLSPPLIVAVLATFTSFLTEVASNGSIASVFLPIVAQLAITLELSPLYFMLPVTQACSYSFMLPVGNPPNALTYDAGQMKIIDMVKPGFFANLLCVLINIGLINSLGKVLFQLDTLPDWANVTTSRPTEMAPSLATTLLSGPNLNETFGVLI